MPKELVVQQPSGMETLTPMQMIHAAYQSAIERGAGLEVVNSIVAQMREERDYRDREMFNAALGRIQAALKPVPKRGKNPQTNSKFATAEDIDAQLEPLLQAEGMTLSFEPEPTGVVDMMRVVAILSRGAYSRRYPMDMPCDGQGPKGGGVMSRTHATGSGITLCKRYLKNAIFNLRFQDPDDDGNAAGITQDYGASLIVAINEQDDPKTVMGAWTVAIAEAKKFTPPDYKAITLFTEARDERLKALRGVK